MDMHENARLIRAKTPGVADLLSFPALIDSGVVLTKEGALIAGWFFRGSDVAAMSPEEKNYRAARLNTALSGHGSGWAWGFDASRLAAASYPGPAASHFTLILLAANLFSLLATVGASVLRPSRATPEAALSVQSNRGDNR
jgi:type IV secretory pathway VirB4 component